MGEQRFFTPEPQVKSDTGTTEALFTVGNTLGQKLFHPEFRVDNTPDEGFNLGTYLSTIPEEDRAVVLGANNESYANNLLARKYDENEALRAIDDLPWYGKYPGLLATGIVDPINAVPIGGVLSKTTNAWKTYDRLNRVVKLGAQGAVIGAVSNVAAEGIMAAQGFETDYVSAAYLGVVLGGGLGGMAGSLSDPNIKPIANTMVDKTDYLDHLEIDPNITQVTGDLTPGAVPMFKSGVPKAPDGGFLFPKMFKSDVQVMAEHDNSLVRAYGYLFASPTNAAKDAAGNPIAIKDTIADRTTQWAGDKQTTDLEVTTLYTEAKKTGYDKSFNDMQVEISETYREAASRQEHEIDLLVNNKLEEAKRTGVIGEELDALKAELTTQAYEVTPITFKGSEVSNRGADIYRQYYTKHLDRMQKLDMEGTKGLHKNRLYMPRVYNNERIRLTNKADLTTRVRQAVMASPSNKDLVGNPKSLDIAVNDIVDTLKSTAIKNEFLDYSYIAPKELPLATHLKQRKIKLDDATMGDLLIQDSQNLAGMYSYKMTRQQAIHYKFGTTNLDEIREQYIKPIQESLIKDGGDTKIIENMENAFKDAIGILRMAPDGNSLSHTFSRLTGSYDSMTMGGSFGFNNIAEVPAAMWATGFRNVFNSQYGKSIGAVKDILFKESKAGNFEFANELIGLGHMTDALRASNAQRMTDMDAHFSSGSFETALQKGTETLFKFNGLRASTAALEAIVSNNALSDIPRLSKSFKEGRLSIAERNRVARWGLDETNLHELAKAIETNTIMKGGKLQELGLENWSQKDVDTLSTVTNRAISESIIQTDTVHLPTFMKLPKPMTKLLTRFLRYPIAAHGILLQKGMTDDKAGLITNILSGVMMFGMFKYLQEQAQVAVGDKQTSETKFDIFNDKDAWSRLIIKSMNYSGGLGVSTVLLDHSMTLLGQEQLGTEYRQDGLSLLGPTAGRINSIQTLGQALIEGEWTGTKDYNALKSFFPGATAPGVSEALNATAEAWDVKR